ncbi:MAG: AI-2E family transporter [Paraperlucidibaca sp.]
MTVASTHILTRILLFIGLAALGYLTYSVISPFFIPMAWAAILVFVTWPIYRRLYNKVGQRPNVAAALMTALLTLVLLGPLAWLVLLLQTEIRNIYAHIGVLLAQSQLPISPKLATIAPWLYDELQRWWTQTHINPEAAKESIRSLASLGLPQAKLLAGGIGRNLAKLGFTVFTAFFFYRDGLALMRQTRRALSLITPGHGERYVKAAGDMTRAVVFGIVLTAFAQAALAGAGYAVAGAPNPIFLAAITFLVALVPFGTPFAWGGVALWLFATGDTFSAVGLMIWGALVISSVDNIIRPLVISTATQVSFLLIMFGVLGGLTAFGMIGLFIGPVILAVVLAIWKEWLEQPTEPSSTD